MNLHDEMAFCMGVVEPEKAKRVNMEEICPDASGCTMTSTPITSKAKQEIAEMFELQNEMVYGIKKESQTERKVSGEKRNKFLKSKPMEEANVLVHREIVDKFLSMEKEEQRIVLKILIDRF